MVEVAAESHSDEEQFTAVGRKWRRIAFFLDLFERLHGCRINFEFENIDVVRRLHYHVGPPVRRYYLALHTEAEHLEDDLQLVLEMNLAFGGVSGRNRRHKSLEAFHEFCGSPRRTSSTKRSRE